MTTITANNSAIRTTSRDVTDPICSNTVKEKIAIEDEFRRDKNWFIIVKNNLGQDAFYDLNNFKEKICFGLIDAKFKSDSPVEIHYRKDYDKLDDTLSKKANAKWERDYTTVKEMASEFNKLQNLYNPIWNNAMIGLEWGIYIGIGLKCLETLITLGTVDISFAFFFLITIGVVFIPRIGFYGIIILSIIMNLFTGVNFFITVLTAGLTGTILGSLPGMALGGIYGIIGRTTWGKAHDAKAEGFGTILKAIILPLLGGTAIILCYIFILQPWLISFLE